MRFLAAIMLFSSAALADWKDSVRWYLVNEVTGPLVALTTNKLHGIFHASSPYTSVQIGNASGFLTNYCTEFLPPESPCGSIENCQWTYLSRNETNDAYLWLTCRPVTNGITFVATNYSAGTPVVWWSNARQLWLNATIQSVSSLHTATFADTTTAWVGTVVIQGAEEATIIGDRGDSESPVFTTNGDFVCAINSPGTPDDGLSVGVFAYPEGAQYRPRISGAAISALFNSDPDR